MELSKFLRSCVETFFESTFLPTGHDLLEELYIVCGVTIVSTILEIVRLPHIYNMGGCFTALVVIIIAIIIERKEYSEISKVSRLAELHFQSAKSGFKKFSEDIKSSVNSHRVSGITKGNAKRPANKHRNDSEAE